MIIARAELLQKTPRSSGIVASGIIPVVAKKLMQILNVKNIQVIFEYLYTPHGKLFEK